MPLMLIIKLLAGAVAIGAIAFTTYTVKDFTGSLNQFSVQSVKSQSEQKLEAKFTETVQLDNEPGKKAFQRAEELLAIGTMEAAEERLKYIIANYPASKSASKARKILGEINIDRLLDLSSMEGKQEVVVKSGDTYSRIVNKYETTLDSIVYLTGLKRADARSLHPGDKLIVMPMKMRIVIDIRRKKITIFDQEVFVKEYSILKSNYKGGNKKGLKVASIRGVINGKTIPSHHAAYLTADKRITLSDQSLIIRSNLDEDVDDFSVGFTLSPADMAELPLLIRSGNNLEIRR